MAVKVFQETSVYRRTEEEIKRVQVLYGEKELRLHTVFSAKIQDLDISDKFVIFFVLKSRNLHI